MSAPGQGTFVAFCTARIPGKNLGLRRVSLWHLRVTFVALSTSDHQSCTGARRQPREPGEADAAEASTYRRYKGVRFRPGRKSWVAEMKPFKYKNKVSFGDFKSAMEAARAVDAAFFYYDKNKWRNFRDSPKFLPPLPAPLTEEEKLKFVKGQARSLAFIALCLPSTWERANRCEELKSTPLEPDQAAIACPIPTTSTWNSNNSEAIVQQEALDALLPDFVAETAASPILLREEAIRADALDLAEDCHSEASIQSFTKTLSCASASSMLETFPEVPDDGNPWIPAEGELLLGEDPLDVNDYCMDFELSAVEGNVYALQ